MILTVAGLLLISAPNPTSDLLTRVTTLDTALERQETKLAQMRAQETALEKELAQIETKLATAQIGLDESTARLRKRLRALTNMPNGTRLAIFGGTKSLQEYLQTQWTLRKVTQHDRAVHTDYQDKLNTIDELQQHFKREKRHLADITAAIRQERDTIAQQRSKRMAFLHQLVVLQKGKPILSGVRGRANRRLQRALGKLTPSQETQATFRANKRHLPWPAVGRVKRRFGKWIDRDSETHTNHPGITIRASAGNPVQAIADGEIVFADWLTGYGKLVIIDHGQHYHSVSGHLAQLNVRVGQPIRQHDQIGVVGDTGSIDGTQLYFELRHRGQAMNPQEWLRR